MLCHRSLREQFQGLVVGGCSPPSCSLLCTFTVTGKSSAGGRGEQCRLPPSFVWVKQGGEVRLTLEAASQSYADSSSYRATTLSWDILSGQAPHASLSSTTVQCPVIPPHQSSSSQTFHQSTTHHCQSIDSSQVP